MSALLFAGPTLSGWKGRLPDAVTLRPPAAAGDILAAIRAPAPPRAIGLVDGVFGLSPSVWHKEILDALDRGIAVLGAASLGALRAAELHRFGMVGVGRVFEAYRDGRQLRDDAVLVAHAPAELGYRPLSVALVDFEEAVGRAGLPADVARALVRHARRLPAWERELAAICRAAGEADAVSWEAQISPHLAPGLKQQDAMQLVAMLADAPPPPPGAPRLVRTGFYREMESGTKGWSGASSPA